MTAEQLTQRLILELEDIYHAEKQLVRALPKMAKATDCAHLKEAIEKHLKETENQVARLEKAFSLLEMAPKAKTCKGMQGLISEGSEALDGEERSAARDLAIIGAAQRIEHYEIAAYGTARTLAERAGNQDVARLLQQTEDEEKAADHSLSQIADEIYEDTGESMEAQGVSTRGTQNSRKHAMAGHK